MESEALRPADYKGYAWGGWLAIISGILIVPEMILAVGLGLFSPDLKILVAPIHTVNLVIGIYILWMFRHLLNHRFDFHKADLLIMVLIAANLVFFIIGLIEFAGELYGLNLEAEYSLTIVTLVLFVLYCLINIGFAVTLLQMKDNLFGLLQPYAYLVIISSVLGATVLLAPLGLLVAVAGLVVLGMIFLRAQREADIL